MRKFLKKYLKNNPHKKYLYDFLFFIYLKSKKIIEVLKNLYIKLFLKHARIFLYHRVINIEDDPLMLSVPLSDFERHLKKISKKYKIVKLSELSKKIQEGKIIGNEASITFDDGYKDNLTNALPLLEKYNIPATIFVTTGQIGQKASFKWDLEYKENDRAFFLSTEDIKQLSKNNLIEIGAHTHNHPRLSDLNYQEQLHEIKISKEILEKITNKKITLFAYPFGGNLDINRNSIRAVRESGFDFAFTNTNILSNKTQNKFKISRINIRKNDF